MIKETQFNHRENMPTVEEPEALAYLVRHKEDKLLHTALGHVAFTYRTLYAYLVREDSSVMAPGDRSKAAFLSRLMEVSESTFYRWKKSEKTVEKRDAERLAELMHLYAYGEEGFGSRPTFEDWLNTPNVHLDQQAPVTHLDSLPGLRYIRHLLDKIEYGAPV